MIKAALLGATGYAGQQLTALLQGHPYVQLHIIGSHGSPRSRLSDDYGKFEGHLNDCDVMVTFEEFKMALISCDVLFLALPHGSSTDIVSKLIQDPDYAHLKIIDLGSDFRFNPLYPESVYGLSEINRTAIQTSRLVANPGCYPTAAILGLKPLFESISAADGNSTLQSFFHLDDLSKETIIVDAKSGISGAGRTPVTKHLFAEVYGNAYPYKLGEHPHTLEIEAALALTKPIQFTPNIIPVNRGIIENIYIKLPLKEHREAKGIEYLFQELYSDYYRQGTFVRIRKNRLPMLTDVTHSNHCDIGFKYDSRTGMLMIISAIDNLMKGAAGQAIQNMNLMFKFDESAGLNYLPAHL